MDRHPEQDLIITSLEEQGTIQALRSAHDSSVASALSLYDEEAGHDATLLGTLRHNQLCDRMDRVGLTGKYVTPEGDSSPSGLDVARLGLSSEEASSFTPLESGILARRDYRQSPAWMCGNVRIFLQSFKFGKVNRIAWHTFSKTKHEIASLPYSSPIDSFSQQGGLFPDPNLHETAAEEAPTNLVLAHSLDPVTLRQELYLGRPRATKEKETSWHWYEKLNIDPFVPIPSSKDAQKPAPLNDPTEDAPVQIRKTSERKNTNHDGQKDHFGS